MSAIKGSNFKFIKYSILLFFIMIISTVSVGGTVYELHSAEELIIKDQTVKAEAEDVKLFRFNLSADNNETLHSVSFKITDEGTGVTNTDIIGVSIYYSLDGISLDEKVGHVNSDNINIGSITEVIVNDELNSEGKWYIATIDTSLSWSDEEPVDSIKIQVYSGTNTYKLGLGQGTVGATGLVGKNLLIADTTPPFFYEVNSDSYYYREGKSIHLFANLSESGLFVTTDLSEIDNDMPSDFVFTDNEDGTYSAITPPLGDNTEEGEIKIVFNALDEAGNSCLNDSLKIVVDNKRPTIFNVSSLNGSGWYRAGDVIDIVVEFCEVVDVEGSPVLEMVCGGREAVYREGSGTEFLVFEYVVMEDDGSGELNYAGIDSLGPADVNITDMAGNEAFLELPDPEDSGSLADAGIFIDNDIPYADTGMDKLDAYAGIEFELDGNSSYDEMSGIGSYRWDMGDGNISEGKRVSYTFYEPGTYNVTLIVEDRAGNTASSSMDLIVELMTYGLELDEGWNLISSPFFITNRQISSVLEDLDGLRSVWTYNTESCEWVSYKPGLEYTGALESIDAGRGYWIEMDGPETLTFRGSSWTHEQGSLQYPVHRGWNLIGLHSHDPEEAERYLSAISGNYSPRIHSYLDGNWYIIDDDNTNESILKPGSGYWIYLHEDDMLTRFKD